MVVDFWNIALIVFYIILIVLLLFFFIGQVILRIIRKKHPFPIPAFATRLIDNPFRRKFLQNPQKIAQRMHLEPGMRVIEIGPGKGSYTKVVAEAIAPGGVVFAIDIQESIIKRLDQRIKKEGINNIIPIVENAYDLQFEDNSIDRIYLITCLPEIPEPVKALCEFKRVLKEEGIISLSELLLDPDYPFRKTEKRWAKEAGLEFIEGFGNFFVYQLNFGNKKIE